GVQSSSGRPGRPGHGLRRAVVPLGGGGRRRSVPRLPRGDVPAAGANRGVARAGGLQERLRRGAGLHPHPLPRLLPAGLRRVGAHRGPRQRAEGEAQHDAPQRSAGPHRPHPCRGPPRLQGHGVVRRHHRARHPRIPLPGRRAPLRRHPRPARLLLPRVAGTSQTAAGALPQCGQAHRVLRQTWPRRGRPGVPLRCAHLRRRPLPGLRDRFKNGFDTNPAIDHAFATTLKKNCDKDFPRGTVEQNLDRRTPDIFDNKYYFDLIAKQGLFKSDQGLIDHPATKSKATHFSLNQGAFFDQFAKSMAKMVKMDLLTGNKGEIRANCKVRGKPPRIQTAVDDEGIAADM
uniref:Peroxidase n=1 Tax=Aegilops tauschii subsp. strangulata TaxID=200361 RepID=A0A453DJP2_AEGTS